MGKIMPIKKISRKDRERDVLLGLVDLYDAGLNFLSWLEDVLDLLHAIFADLGDMNESVDVAGEFDECSKVGNL